MLKSIFNWAGREVNGVILGEPNTDLIPGFFVWDGGVPTGIIDVDGIIWVEETNAGA